MTCFMCEREIALSKKYRPTFYIAAIHGRPIEPVCICIHCMDPGHSRGKTVPISERRRVKEFSDEGLTFLFGIHDEQEASGFKEMPEGFVTSRGIIKEYMPKLAERFF